MSNCQKLATGPDMIPRARYIRAILLVDAAWIRRLPTPAILAVLGDHNPGNFLFYRPGTTQRLHVEMQPRANLCPGAARGCQALALHTETSIKYSGPYFDQATHRTFDSLPRAWNTLAQQRNTQAGTAGATTILAIPGPGCRDWGKTCTGQ